MTWYVSFHGGDDPDDRNNIHRYDRQGAHLGKALDGSSLPDGMRLRELRGFVFGPDGDLYVANAWKDQSQILRFAGAPGEDGRHAFRSVFAGQRRSDGGLAHPFDVAFGPDGHLYVPSQDSDIVGRYYGPASVDGEPGAPMPHPPAIAHLAGKLPPGTFVPSARHSDTGLRAVRHAIFGPDGHLYVADRDRDSVGCYDRESGELLRRYRHDRLAAPVHLLPWPEQGALLAGSRDRDTVIALDLATGAARDLLDRGKHGLDAPSGLAWGPDGLLHVASRTGRSILRFDAATGGYEGALVSDLPDDPEFIAWVPGSGAG
jgi:DNA-binding beta-propeller fold protein YncE